MPDSNFWTDFVWWVAESKYGSEGRRSRLLHARNVIRDQRDARVVLFAGALFDDEDIGQVLAEFTHETGRTPPEDIRGVDVPPGGGRAALLRLASACDEAAENAINGINPTQWDRGVGQGLRYAAGMAREAAEKT